MAEDSGIALHGLIILIMLCLQAVDRQISAAEQDHRMLTQQLVAEQQGLAEDVQKLQETRYEQL